MSLVRDHPGVFRAHVPDLLDLSQQSVHRLVERLVGLGLLSVVASPSGRPGKPSPRLQVRGEAAYAVGVTINWDTIVVVLLDLASNLLEERRWRTVPLSRDQSLERLAAEIADMLRVRKIKRQQVIGAGVAIGGFFYSRRERLMTFGPIQDWSDAPLRPLVEERIGLPVMLANNARTAAFGESVRGIGRIYRTFAYLHFHWGFGTGIVIDRAPYWGPRGNAGEIAVVYSDEEIADRPTLFSLIEALRKRDLGVTTIEDLATHFDPNWPEVSAWVERVAPGLNRAIHALSGVLDPEAIIFGGHAPPALAHALIQKVQFRGPNELGVMTPRPDLVISESVGDASSCGAAMMPLRDMFFL